MYAAASAAAKAPASAKQCGEGGSGISSINDIWRIEEGDGESGKLELSLRRKRGSSGGQQEEDDDMVKGGVWRQPYRT